MCCEVKRHCNATTLFANEAIGPKELAGCCIRRAHSADGSFVFFVVREAPYAYQSLLSLGSFWLLPQRTRTIKNLSTGGQ